VAFGPDVVEHEPAHRPGAAIVLVAGVGAALAGAVAGLPREHAALPTIARYATVIALPAWHTTEAVNEIVYGTRGFDTFGETFLLLAAIVGIGTITRHKERRRGFIGEEQAGGQEQQEIGERPSRRDPPQAEARQAETGEEGGPERPPTPDATPVGLKERETAEAMTVVVRAPVRAIAPVLAIAGLYLVAWGYSPGGGFPGGAVLLGVVLLAWVAYGYRKVQRIIRPDVVEPLELAGAAAIIAIEVLGLVLKGSFSANFLPLGAVGTIRSGGILQAFSGAELIEVATGLTLAVFGMLGMAHDWSHDDDRGSGGDHGTDSPFSQQ
jgi:multicomponent Na+:H+ antiporter subunit B